MEKGHKVIMARKKLTRQEFLQKYLKILIISYKIFKFRFANSYNRNGAI